MLATTYGGFWDYWELRHKTTFDGPNRLVLVNSGVTDIDVQRDIYSSWKEWVQLYDHAKFVPALRSTGGDPLPGEGNFLDGTFFFINGWRLKSWPEAEHSLTVTGNLYTEEGETPFIPVPGVSYEGTVSNIVRRIQDEAEGLSQEELDAIADAVWNSLSASFGTAGTFGELLNNVLQAVSGDSIASAVLDAALADHNDPDTVGEQIQKKKKLLHLGTVIKEV